ncbi:hypothetical protein QTP81_00835 [Alteromonas sp. ASW11-36]|uniref:MSHA biogenesis protein MshK n=1 Tax=Alteromonas arenosi TaxID=3055817 RepID=A0ABT7SSI4_9ALTE|nr:hypothetical protein [Alteromonas sp. ASW11-36]MDM7859147.1 hypothetical protein [Alteromonas sp. ASW11-36]
MTRLGFGLLLICAATAQAQGIKDPTRPTNMPAIANTSAGSTTQNGSLNLDAVLFTQRHRVAVINGVPMRVGDEYLGTKIKQIEADSVVVELSLNGTIEERVLHVNSTGEIKSNATETF